MKLNKSATGRKTQPWALWLLLLLVAVFLFIAILRPGATLAFDNEPVYAFSDGWSLLDASGGASPLALPAKLQAQGAVRITKTVTEIPTQPAVLCMRTAHQQVRLFCDDQLIYSFGYDNLSIFGKSPGSCWNLIRLPPDIVGKTLTLELYSPYPSYNGIIEEIQVGSKAAQLFSLLRRHFISLLLTLVILGAGIVTLLAYFLVIRKDAAVGRETLYLGLFSVFVSIWMFGEGRLTQFFGVPPALNTCITFVSLMAIAIPLMLYVACGLQASRRRLLEIASRGLCVLLVASLLLQGLGLLDFIQQLPLIHTCFIISCFVILYAVIADAMERHRPEQYRLVLSLAVLAFFFVLETLTLYFERRSVGGLMRIGVLAFITIQAQAAFKKAAGMMHLSRLASTDALTGCLNRTVYQQAVIDLDGQRNVGVVIADINDLKVINDVHGHDVGDDAITRCSDNFSQAFSGCGRCFRIGGDEFAMLSEGLTLAQLEAVGEVFTALNAASGAQTTYPFTVSWGHAVYDPQQDQSLSDTVRRADKSMYYNKRLFKSRNA